MNSEYLKQKADSVRDRLEGFFRHLDWKFLVVVFILISMALLLYHTYRFMSLMGL